MTELLTGHIRAPPWWVGPTMLLAIIGLLSSIAVWLLYLPIGT